MIFWGSSNVVYVFVAFIVIFYLGTDELLSYYNYVEFDRAVPG